jgi:hypothetical protein
MTVSAQGSLLDLIPPAETCVTCGAERPADYTRALWLEPVSGECLECNHATLHQILHGPDREAAWQRHIGVIGREREARQAAKAARKAAR